MVLREVSKIDVNYVKKLYKEAFPIRERMPFSRLLKLQKNNIINYFFYLLSGCFTFCPNVFTICPLDLALHPYFCFLRTIFINFII